MTNKKSDTEWAKAKKICKLNTDTIQMAKEMGLNPRTLIKNIPNKSERWKAPVEVWIREMYSKQKRKKTQKKIVDKKTGSNKYGYNREK